MKNEFCLRVGQFSALSENEMKAMTGGGLIDRISSALISLAIQGIVSGGAYFYRLGKMEAQTYKQSM